MSTVFIPKIGPSKRARDPEHDPWVIKPVKNPNFILTGVNPIGTVHTVPTTVRKICTTRLRATAPEPVYDDNVAIPVPIQWYQPPDEKVAAHMRELCQAQKNTTKQENTLRPLLSRITFAQALEIYENNQVYYQDKLEQVENAQLKEATHSAEIIRQLNELEHWFIVLMEPNTTQEQLRQKLIRGHSEYCALPLRSYITPLPASVVNVIQKQIAQVKSN